jgi:hypothetical protein
LPQQPPSSSSKKRLWTSAVGRAGEHFAAAVIELQGWGVFIANLKHIDLLAVKDDKVLRIQVKATQGRDTNNKYHFSLGRGTGKTVCAKSVDIVACVMLDTRRVYFMPAYGLSSSFAVNNKLSALEDMEQRSWEATLKKCAVSPD